MYWMSAHATNTSAHNVAAANTAASFARRSSPSWSDAFAQILSASPSMSTALASSGSSMALSIALGSTLALLGVINSPADALPGSKVIVPPSTRCYSPKDAVRLVKEEGEGSADDDYVLITERSSSATVISVGGTFVSPVLVAIMDDESSPCQGFHNAPLAVVVKKDDVKCLGRVASGSKWMEELLTVVKDVIDMVPGDVTKGDDEGGGDTSLILSEVRTRGLMALSCACRDASVANEFVRSGLLGKFLKVACTDVGVCER